MTIYSTYSDAEATIIDAIEATGEATRDEFDIDAIFEKTFTWVAAIDENGAEHVQLSGYQQVVDTDEFWTIVMDNAR